MTMHQHDTDLIMALAAGELGERAELEAEATIAACPDCRRDLELQRAALVAIAAAPRVYLTARESANLHAAIARESGAAARRPARSSVLVRRLTFAFGTAAVLVGLVFAGTGLLRGGDDADSGDIAALRDAAATAPVPAVDGATAADTESLAGGGESVAQNQDLTEAGSGNTLPGDTTTVASSATTTAAALPPLPRIRLFAEQDPAQIKSTVLLDLAESAGGSYAGDASAREATPGLTACLTELEDEIADNVTASYVAGAVIAPDGSQQYVVAFITDDVATATVAAINVDPCAIAAIYP